MSQYESFNARVTASTSSSTTMRLWVLLCVLRLLAAATAFILGFFGEFRDAGFLSPWDVGVPVLAYAVFGPVMQWRSKKTSPSISLAVADSAVGLTAVGLSGGWQSPYFLLLLPAVVSVSLSMRLPNSLFATLVISGAYVAVAALAVSHGGDGNEIDVITDNFAILLVTALVTSTLNQQWRDESLHRSQEEQLARKLGILNRLLRETFPVSLDQDVALRTAVDLTRAAMECDVAGILVRSGETWRVWTSPPLERELVLSEIPLDDQPSIAAGVLTFEDVSLSRYAAPLWGDLKVRGIAISPIHAGDRLYGYLFTGSRTQHRYLEEDGHLLTAISHHVGLGARNADLYTLEREQVRRLRDIERLKTDFFNNVSHDLLTPLGAVTTATGLLVSDKDSRLSPLAASLLSNIERNADRLNVMVKDLLEVARIQSGRVTLRRTQVAPRELVREAVDAVTPQFKAKRQRLELVAPRGLPSLWADEERLQRVLVNLLQNAHTYTPEEGTISIIVDSPNGSVRFAVNDTGPGILPEQQGRVFERFYRPEGSIERSGTGLGLSIAKTLVELHGGNIRVESRPGTGASFILEIPVSDKVDDEDSHC